MSGVGRGSNALGNSTFAYFCTNSVGVKRDFTRCKGDSASGICDLIRDCGGRDSG